MNDAEKIYWVKQANGWAQGSLVSSTGTVPAVHATPSPGGRGLPWETVDFLLQHLGFTAMPYPDYVTYNYRGDKRYTASYYSKAHAPQWTDAQVREILAYASLIIHSYEASQDKPSRTVSPPPPDTPLNELTVEEW